MDEDECRRPQDEDERESTVEDVLHRIVVRWNDQILKKNIWNLYSFVQDK